MFVGFSQVDYKLQKCRKGNTIRACARSLYGTNRIRRLLYLRFSFRKRELRVEKRFFPPSQGGMLSPLEPSQWRGLRPLQAPGVAVESLRGKPLLNFYRHYLWGLRPHAPERRQAPLYSNRRSWTLVKAFRKNFFRECLCSLIWFLMAWKIFFEKPWQGSIFGVFMATPKGARLKAKDRVRAAPFVISILHRKQFWFVLPLGDGV